MTEPTPTQLLMPRFECIADYPKSIHHIGTILNAGGRYGDILYCDENGPRMSQYPHLFRKLNWWERRAIDEMPEYVKVFGGIYRISKWEKVDNTLRFRSPECYGGISFDVSNAEPLTELDYTNYLATKK